MKAAKQQMEPAVRQNCHHFYWQSGPCFSCLDVLGLLWNSRNVSLFQVQMFLFLHTQSTNYECDGMTIKPIVCSCMPWKPCLCMFCFHKVQYRHTIKEQSYCHHHRKKICQSTPPELTVSHVMSCQQAEQSQHIHVSQGFCPEHTMKTGLLLPCVQSLLSDLQ